MVGNEWVFEVVSSDTSVFLAVPWPPTVNTYWRSTVQNGRPKVLISERGRAYRKLVAKLALIHKVNVRLPGRLSVTLKAYPPDRRKRDLDNILKSLLDSLQHAGVYQDDSQIDELSILRLKDKKDLVEISIHCRL